MPIYEYKCKTCGRIIELLVRSGSKQPRCKHCDSTQLKRLISRPGLIRGQTGGDDGRLRPVEPRRAVEHMSRTYDQTGIDPGQGFAEVAKRVDAGDSPQELKEAVKEARKNESSSSTAATNDT